MTAPFGLITAGVIFNIKGNKLSNKADEAWREAKKHEKLSDEICEFLYELNETANNYCELLERVNCEYISV